MTCCLTLRIRTTAPFASLRIPDEIRRAVIVHRGALTPAYAYLGAYLAERAGRLA